MSLVGDTVESAGQQYLDAGYTLAVLYYRLPRSATTTSWLVCSNPYEAVDDVAAAMTHLQENAVEYNVDANQIVFSGFSAGGHLASLYSSLCAELKLLVQQAKCCTFHSRRRAQKSFVQR